MSVTHAAYSPFHSQKNKQNTEIEENERMKEKKFNETFKGSYREKWKYEFLTIRFSLVALLALLLLLLLFQFCFLFSELPHSLHV